MPRSHTMAETVEFSKATIGRIWQTFGLQSHRVDTFARPTRSLSKVRDIVGLYLNPGPRWCSASMKRVE